MSSPGDFQESVDHTYSSRWLISTEEFLARNCVIWFTFPWMAKPCNASPPVSSFPGAAMALTDPPIPPLPAVDETDTLIPKSSSHTSRSSRGSLAAPEPGTHPSPRATSRYLVSASAPSAYFFPILFHASHLARPVRSKSDGRGF